MKCLYCFILILVSAVFSYPQDESVAKVYVYQLKHVKTLGRVAPPVYLDDKEIAKLDGERFFVVRLAPGRHTFRLKDKKRGGIEMEFKAGETYYVRMEMREGTTVGPSGLTLVPLENATYELKQMKPIKPKDIKDHSLVRDN
jgi:Protein of unknown function (DUF2846)